MTIRTEQALISAEAFWDMIQQPEYTDRRVEQIEGVMVEMCCPALH